MVSETKYSSSSSSMVSETAQYSSDQAAATARPSTAGVRSFVSRVSETTQAAVVRQRPWRELMDCGAFSKPASFADAGSRLKKNFRYFSANYVVFMLVIVGLSLLWHPISLLVLAILLLTWVYFYFGRSEPVVVFNRIYSPNEVLVVLSIVTIVALYFTHARLPLTIALLVGIGVLCVHATFRRPDDLFLDEEENASSGLLSFPTSTGVSRV